VVVAVGMVVLDKLAEVAVVLRTVDKLEEQLVLPDKVMQAVQVILDKTSAVVEVALAL